MALAPPIKSGEYNRFQDTLESGKWHWTLGLYGDWSEPGDWDSDYITYLTTIGMTRSVLEKISLGYDPCKRLCRRKSGERYSRSNAGGSTAAKGCKPNEKFESFRVGDFKDVGLRTVWEAVLEHIHQRFIDPGDRFQDHNLGQDVQALHCLKYRWLETVNLFLKYGADPTQSVASCIYTGSRCHIRAFTDIDDPLASSIRHMMLSAGATQKEHTGKERDISKLDQRNNREINEVCKLMQPLAFKVASPEDIWPLDYFPRSLMYGMSHDPSSCGISYPSATGDIRETGAASEPQSQRSIKSFELHPVDTSAYYLIKLLYRNTPGQRVCSQSPEIDGDLQHK
ncbi:hypothetical protein PG995_000321 [Apiospora arundinis]